MRRSPSEDLFRLIKSLHKGEKRTFKLLTGLLAGGRDKRYTTLFDLIDRQDTYNESKLMKHFGDLTGSQFSAGKNYLYRFILKSLVYYDTDPEAEVAQLIAQVRMLARKELYPQARKMLRKALKISREGEFFSSQHSLLSIELDILINEQHERQMESQIEEIDEAKQLALKRLHNLDAYIALNSRMYTLMNRRRVARDDQDIESYRAIADHPLLESPARALSVRAEIEYWTVQAKLASFRDDLKGAVELNRGVLELLEKHDAIRGRMLRRYFLEVSTLGIHLLKMADYENAFAVLERFRELKENYPKVRANYFPLYFIANMTLAVQLGEVERIQPILEEIDVFWNEIHARTPGWHEMLLSYLVAHHYLNTGEPSKALRWVNLIVNSPRSDLRIYLQGFARLLVLMVHFDLGNYSVVESSHDSARRFLQKHGRMHRFEKTVLKSFRTMVKHVNTPQYRRELELLFQEFRALAQDEFEQRAFSFLDFGEWLEGKLNDTDIAALRRGRSTQKWPD
ncbi:MAG: hypothetical protein AAGN35_08025 [Bacteroidota bacterium]